MSCNAIAEGKREKKVHIARSKCEKHGWGFRDEDKNDDIFDKDGDRHEASKPTCINRLLWPVWVHFEGRKIKWWWIVFVIRGQKMHVLHATPSIPSKQNTTTEN